MTDRELDPADDSYQSWLLAIRECRRELLLERVREWLRRDAEREREDGA